MAIDMWSRILGLIADGVLPHKAIETVGATRALVEGMLRGRPECRKQWEDAKIAALRRHWDADMLTEICNKIAAGASVQRACKEVGRPDETFVRIVLADPLLREEYEMARKIRAELWADEIVEISDDDGNDMDLVGKGNTAAVNRSKLRVETRRGLMKDYNRAKYGDTPPKQGDVNIQVNLNAAERLESARARRLAITAKPVDAIDAEVVSESSTKGTGRSSRAAPPSEATPRSTAPQNKSGMVGRAVAADPILEAAGVKVVDRSWLEG